MPIKDPQKRREAYKRWYEKNRLKYNAKRKQRYKNDPTYRERMKTMAAATKEKAKRERDGRTQGESDSG